MRARRTSAGLGMSLLLLAGNAVAQQAKKPPVPKGIDPGGVAVAVIGAGVDYTRPEIAKQLARDGEGELIGWDFIDNDQRPYAAGSSGSILAAGFVARFVTGRLVPVRVDRSDPQSLTQAIAFIAATPARVVVVPMRPEGPLSWKPLRQLAEKHKQLLFMIATGEKSGGDAMAEGWPAIQALDNVVSTSYSMDHKHDPATMAALAVEFFVTCYGPKMPGASGAAMRALFVQTLTPSPDPVIREIPRCVK